MQSSPVENQLHNASETDSFLEEVSSLEVTKVGNHGNESLVNDTFEELLAIPEEAMINQTHDPLENENLFEGDLAIPEELIEEYYGNSTRAKRGAVRSNSRLWPSGRVYYQFASCVNSNNREIIRSAIRYYQHYTCLRFYYRSSQNNYVEFTTSDSVTRNMYASSGRDTDHSDIRMCSVLWSCSDNVPTNIRKSNLSCESPTWPFGAVRDRSIHLDFIGR